MAKGNFAEVQLALNQSCKALTEDTKKLHNLSSNSPFSYELFNPDTDLSELAGMINDLGALNSYSFCLYGPPGTGKSAYIRHLAKKIGLKVIEKRASDLLSMFVGGTEQNLARVFEEARDEKAFLVFDEADSLLQSRNDAVRSWEITQVNELLTWMESHPYPFACTTNMFDSLDQAALRRFVFKIRCGYLSKRQCKTAFAHFFKTGTDECFETMDNLTPGDFVTVSKKARLSGVLDRPTELVEMLKGESRVKSGNKYQIGFTV